MPYSLQELLGFAQGAGFTGDAATKIAAISYAESSGNPAAINYADPGGSYGLTQINAAAHGPSAVATLNNPAEAFAQAFRISNGGTNFTPWSTYNNGAYLPFLASLGGGGAGGAQGSGGGPGGGGGGAGGFSGTTAGGTPVTSQSPLSAIFSSVGNFFQTAGILILGVILVAIGAWFTARSNG